MNFREIKHVMTNLTPVKSLCEYISAVNYISHTFTDNLWFRGHSKEEYENLPSIYRTGTWIKNDYSFAYEYEIFKTFTRKSKIIKNTDYDYLHLMQHYGLPTRLLDWTESSLIALFFAIHNPKDCKKPTVWILDPWDFNKILHQESIVYHFYGTSVHPKIEQYINPKEGKIENLPIYPAAVYPSFYDERVIAQKSCFLIFGQEKEPIEKLVLRDNYFNLAKINIDTDSASDILIDLNMAGIDYHTIFPDFSGLVLETKRKWELK